MSTEPEPCRLRVLVVDDDPDTADSLAMVLWLDGCEAEVAADGRGALRKAEARPPDVVLIDIAMPGMSGYDLARQLRQRAWVRRPLLVAVTGYAQEEDRRRAVEAGIDLLLAKPADPAGLCAMLRKWAALKRDRQLSGPHRRDDAAVTPPTPLSDGT